MCSSPTHRDPNDSSTNHTASHYESQLNEKIALTQAQLATIVGSDIELQVFHSPPVGFRMRAEFKVWHDDGQITHAMHARGDKKQIIKMTRFDIAHPNISNLMAPLIEAISVEHELKHKLFQIEYLTSTLDQTLVTLIYHKPLTDDWQVAAQKLQSQFDIQVIGRSRKQKVVLAQDYVYEAFTVHQQTFRYQQLEGSFTQPNAAICEDMLNWAYGLVEKSDRDFLELYCGNGNFTLPLSQKFRRTLATEIAKTSIRSAQHNCQINHIQTIDFVRMSSEEFTQALNRERAFNRLQDIDLDQFDFATVLVDPPRSGLDADTCDLITRFDNIIYISCNPETLCLNLKVLCRSHEVHQTALFDQFPYTHHREVGVFLSRKE